MTDDTHIFNPTDKLTIMSPRPSSTARGQNTDKKADKPFSIRFQQEELRITKEAAALLGMKTSEFVRWVSLFCGQEILAQHARSIARQKHRKKARK